MNNLLNTLAKILNNFEGIHVMTGNIEPETFLNFQSQHEPSLSKISSILAALQDQNWKFRILPNEQSIIYQINFFGNIETKKKTIQNMIKVFGKNIEFGLPDLSLVTIKQMAVELKNRKNLCFALVWMEDMGKDNISIEGSGNTNQVIGLLTRGTHMAINWADKNIKFSSE
jgi:hypothetical protein